MLMAPAGCSRQSPTATPGGRIATGCPIGSFPLLRANLVLTCHGKVLPVVARSLGRPNVFSNGCLALLPLAAPLGRFEPRCPPALFTLPPFRSAPQFATEKSFCFFPG
jgi:hypothetical protein